MLLVTKKEKTSSTYIIHTSDVLVYEVETNPGAHSLKQFEYYVDAIVSTDSTTNYANYITRIVELEKQSSGFKLIFDYNKPQEAIIDVYYKTGLKSAYSSVATDNWIKITTTFEDVQNINTFIEKTIDMIEYYHDLTPTKKLKFKFFDSTNNLYPKEMLNNPEDEVIESYIYTSTFPYGHSYKMGRTLLYKMKNVAYNVFKTGYIKWVELNVDLNKKDDDILEVDHNSKTFKDERIESAILDVFDLTDLTPIDLIEDEIFNESLLVESDSPKIKNTTHNFIIM
jgi:hypothetical protein